MQKSKSFLVIIFFVLFSFLTACENKQENNINNQKESLTPSDSIHYHTFSMWEISTSPSCTSQGMQTRTCSSCGFSEFSPIPCLGHTEIIDSAIPASCTAVGKSEGTHCAVCNIVLSEQVELPILDHSWEEATCINPKTCSLCKATEGNVKNHSWKSATCTSPQTCSFCDFSKGYPLGHSYNSNGVCITCGNLRSDYSEPSVTEPSISEPTITSTSTNISLKDSPQTIYITLTNADRLSYNLSNTDIVTCRWGDWEGNTIPLTITPIASGQTTIKIYVEEQPNIFININVNISTSIISQPEHIHSYSKNIVNPTCTLQGYTILTCYCGDSYYDNYIPATGHLEVIDNAVPATHNSTGLTEGKHCAICNMILVQQQIVPKNHSSIIDGTTLTLVNNLSEEYSYYSSKLYTKCKIDSYDYNVTYAYGDNIKLEIKLYIKKTFQGETSINNLKADYTLYHNGIAVKSLPLTVLNAEFDTLYEVTIYHTGSPGNYTLKLNSAIY